MNVHHTPTYEAALQKLDNWQDDVTTDPQRRFRRFRVNAEATLRAAITPLADPTVPIRDMSRGGMSVVIDRPVAPGTLWQVQIGTNDLVVSTVTGVCRFCRCVEGKIHLVGIEFGADAALLRAVGVGRTELVEGDRPETELTSGLPARSAS